MLEGQWPWITFIDFLSELSEWTVLGFLVQLMGTVLFCQQYIALLVLLQERILRRLGGMRDPIPIFPEGLGTSVHRLDPWNPALQLRMSLQNVTITFIFYRWNKTLQHSCAPEKSLEWKDGIKNRSPESVINWRILVLVPPCVLPSPQSAVFSLGPRFV